MAPRSLRSRLFLGWLLWTAGLFGLAVIGGLVLMRFHPDWLLVVHRFLLFSTALIFMGAGLIQWRLGLLPFDALRARLAAVRDGRERRVDGSYPAEVQPLVNDLNALLEHREEVVRRALARAGDLAHGLKTPLAMLSREAELARAAGHADLAAAVDQQVARMARQVDFHLAQARAAAAGSALGARCTVEEAALGLARALRRLHAERRLTIEVRVPSGLSVRCQREDLEEMLGNLLDNACQWARSTVTLQAAAAGEVVSFTVDDDGAGLDPSLRRAVLQRGVRADEAAPGSGLGLAIVRDLAELYGGSIELAASPAGGLRAELRLPG